ncbi:right-handed parallel beta-helix repeat-containing protein [Patescibacteria group bacterium]|nr:right-handed parallel beta-helix repeat-containing protein [Patescibacteria group bacterium]MBU1868634.1 right-handed parallel beta-helix repeat-containing protein [Patescibacteria group bacterium]
MSKNHTWLAIGLAVALLVCLAVTVTAQTNEGVVASCLVRVGEVDYTNVQDAVDAARPGDVVKVAGYCAGSGVSTQYYITVDTMFPEQEAVVLRASPAVQVIRGQGGRFKTLFAESGVEVSHAVVIAKSITIRGGYDPSDWEQSDPDVHPATIDAGGEAYGIYVTDGNVVVENLRVTGGYGWNGAGMRVEGWSANLVMSNCVIFDNHAHYDGGGLYILEDDEAELIGNTIYSNTAGYSGGGMSLVRSNAMVISNTIRYNRAGNGGGGLEMWYSDAVLRGNEIFSNTSLADGGGVLLYNSDALVEGNRIQGNVADPTEYGKGGGLDLYGSDATLRGNAIVSNVAWLAGALYVYDSVPVFENNYLCNQATITTSHETYPHWLVPVALELSPLTETILAGNSQAYSARALGIHDNTWCARGVAYSTPAEAGGVWENDIYVSENAGTWTVIGKYEEVSGYAELVVKPIPTHLVYLPLVARNYEGPRLEADPTSLEFVVSAAETEEADVTLRNVGSELLEIWLRNKEEIPAWFDIDAPGTTLILPGSWTTMQVRVDSAGMEVGEYRYTLAIESNGGNASVAVTMIVVATP